MKALSVALYSTMFILCVVLGSYQTIQLNEQLFNPALVIQKPSSNLPPFQFQQKGQVFTNQNLQGKWTLFFIGYTFCPDICPTTLADLDRVYPKLNNDQSTTTQVVFISVDPNRDKAQQLADYVNYFNKNFIGVTGSHEQLWPLVSELGLIYSVVDEGERDDFYLVDHSASIVLINPKGQFHATFKSELNERGIHHVNMDRMVEDINKLQASYPH